VTSTNGRSSNKGRRGLRVGLTAALLVGCSPIALHAETSNAELAKEIAELKAQIHAMRGAIAENRSETRRTTAKVRAVADRAPVAVAAAPIPEGSTPVFVTANKQMQFGSLTITPGGFVETVGMGRTKSLQSDIISNFNGIPFNNNNLAHVGEGRVSGRQSRVALLVESPISSNMLVAGYGEFDFLAAGVNANNTQVFSYNPRIRHLYTTLDNNEYGIHVLAGQTWSLLVANSKGITPRNEVIVPAIDGGFIPGFNYARTPQIRLVKDFDKKLWLAVSVEAPGTAFNGCNNVVSNAGAAITPTAIAANGVTNVTCLSVGQGAYGNTGLQQQYALNQIPDVQAKVAYEAHIADRDVHLEATGIYRNLLDYVNYGTAPTAAQAANGISYSQGSSQQSTSAYAIAANLIAPVIPRKLDLVLGGLIGRGMGRYTSTGLPDATIDGNGNAKAIPIFTAIAGLTYHVTPAIDLYLYSGIDQVSRATSNNGTVGYGVTVGQNNSGCSTIGGACAGVTHRVWQVTFGMWDKLYKGNFGEVRVGAQYSYTQRTLFSSAAAAGQASFGPTAYDHIIMTSLRYYPFQ
jgi:hypothetical protein